MKSGMKFIAALGAGAVMMYMVDPQQGKARRAQLTGKIKNKAQQVKRTAKKAKQDWINRTGSTVAAPETGPASDTVDDFILAERVRSELGRTTARTDAIEVAANHGRVTLNGTVEAAEMDDVLSRVRSVNGVADVENHLVVH